MNTLHLLSAGAAQSLVKTLQSRFQDENGADVTGRFGAVGAMKEALLAGEACDVMILTDTLTTALVAEGRLRAVPSAALGRVRTGIAVKSGQAPPDVSTPQALKAALLAADVVFFPDAERSTAGIHFAKVMQQLDIAETLRPRWSTWPNGATAMRELAAGTSARAIGCTQLTEIRATPGVDVVGVLPPPFELATVYSAAVGAHAADAALAARFIALITGTSSATARAAAGFED